MKATNLDHGLARVRLGYPIAFQALVPSMSNVRPSLISISGSRSRDRPASVSALLFCFLYVTVGTVGCARTRRESAKTGSVHACSMRRPWPIRVDFDCSKIVLTLRPLPTHAPTNSSQPSQPCTDAPALAYTRIPTNSRQPSQPWRTTGSRRGANRTPQST